MTSWVLNDDDFKRCFLGSCLFVFTSQCNRGPAIDRSYRQLGSRETMIMFLGPQCSAVAHPLCEALRNWNITFVTPLAVSDGLSNRAIYPRLFRLSTSDISMVPARIALMAEFGWTKVSLLRQNDNELFSSVNDVKMDDLMLPRGWTVITYEVFGNEPWKNIQSLQRNDVRVIMAGAYPLPALALVCEAYRLGYYGPRIVWFFPSWYDVLWADSAPQFSNCTRDEILTAINHSIYVGQMMYNPSQEIGISGRTAESFDETFLEYTNGTWPIGSSFRLLTYDSTWHAALALNRTLTKLIEKGSPKRLEDFRYSDIEMADLISTSVSEVAFKGISGKIQFDETGSTHPLVVIQQQLGHKRKTIAYYKLETEEMTWVNGGAEWPDDTVPLDSSQLVFEQTFVSTGLYVTMSTLAGLGIIQAFGFFVFNTVYRSLRIIKMSSPNINNLVIAGSILCYTTVLFADVKGSVIPLTALCCVLQIRLCTFTIGFSLAFGALFAKTWRVHAILTSRKRMKRNMVRDLSLFMMVAALVLIDVSVIVTWQTMDFYSVVHLNATEPVRFPESDIVLLSQIHKCESEFNLYFTATLYLVQGLVIVFGAFLAWETRKVKLDALNDSKLIGFSIYNVVTLSMLGVIIGATVDNDLNMSYGSLSALQLIGTAATLNIVFMPKVRIL
ncbi:hypothetical protein CAPTEDRAFT_109334 [Capitella teleta]|uniref:G-protein coupled receptors family 3 profile domain-containing protein n=1 Tax=Capitella teleta TaxID=283909 RepID=R7U855_CAPTE|nr:hypothetical protein CAPTEDRAFT_109334 [Capitella teleta]|eukprot:ELU02555.1 hypothetical protein CAPTEDRAFT_109334 [Capitella teleta]